MQLDSSCTNQHNIIISHAGSSVCFLEAYDKPCRAWPSQTIPFKNDSILGVLHKLPCFSRENKPSVKLWCSTWHTFWAQQAAHRETDGNQQIHSPSTTLSLLPLFKAHLSQKPAHRDDSNSTEASEALLWSGVTSTEDKYCSNMMHSASWKHTRGVHGLF